MTDPAPRSTMSERIRLIRILRTHGLRAVERMRADELRLALDKLGLTLDEADAGAHDGATVGATASSSSSALVEEPPPAAPAAAPPPPPAEQEREGIEVMRARFREPAVFLPQGERTFLRLIAVDARHVFAAWDLDAGAWQRLGGDDATLELRVAEGDRGDVVMRERVKASARGWYLRAPPERYRVVASLLTPDGDALATSNAAIVPPARPAPPGKLRFATVPISVDRRRLRGGLLLRAVFDEDVELPEGVVLEDAGREVRSRIVEAARPAGEHEHEEEEQAPNSAARMRARAHARDVRELPPVHVQQAPSSWKSAPSSSSSGVVR